MNAGRKTKIGIKEVAQRAGVSTATVSNVLNNKKNVSPERTRRVQIAIKELGYRVDPFARSMKTGQSNTIGLIITDIGGMFYSYVIEALCNYLELHHYHLTVIGTTRNRFMNHLDSNASDLDVIIEKFQSLIQQRVCGIIFSSTFPESMEQTLVDRILEVVGPANIPLVTIGSDFSAYGIDSVYSDSFEGGKKATAHLIKQGCKRIAHITGLMYRRAARQRKEGYEAALAEAHIPIDPNLIAHGDFHHQSAYVAANQLLAYDKNIDGIYVANDTMAIGAMRALRQRNIRIPEDIRIIGYDDVATASILTPPLSSIHVQKREMGTQAAKLLLQRLSEKQRSSEPIVVKLETELIIRQSTSLDALDDWIISDW